MVLRVDFFLYGKMFFKKFMGWFINGCNVIDFVGMFKLIVCFNICMVV